LLFTDGMSNIPSFILLRFYEISLIFIIIIIVLVLSSLLFLGKNAREHPHVKALRVMFGFLWLLDGLLQLQPLMSVGFAEETINPGLIMGTYQPWLSSVIKFFVYIWDLHPITYDALAAAIQIFIGSSLIIGPRGFLYRAGLYISIPWSVLIWVVGEGLGNSFSGGASWIIGSPGSVLVYLFATFILIMYIRREDFNMRAYVRYAFAAMFAVAFIWQVLPQNGYWNGINLSTNTLFMAFTKQPHFLSIMTFDVAMALAANPLLYNSLIAVSLVVAFLLWALIPGRIAASYTIAISVVTWILFLDLGEIFSGYSTDPNTPIPVIAICISYIMMLYERFSNSAVDGSASKNYVPEARI